ncbi:MAG TPA: vitamin K epoxide reductase family protein [Sphingobacteriaceae bacterium]|nr:vitamin K epoxide reductase family protein [Sphingobacteriaceae bacterium]
MVLQHLNRNNVLVQQLCQSKTQEGCETVLSSESAQLTPWLSMAEAGFAYFAGLTLTLIVFDRHSAIYLLPLLAPVFSLYAIYLQAFVIKQWCRLCMAVHAVIFLSFAAAVFIHWRQTFTFPSLAELIAFMLPALIWFFIKPYITQLKKANQYHTEYARLKYSPEVFLALIKSQTKISIPQELKVFAFGNKEAVHELTFVSNPFCGPCAKAHLVIEEWLKQELDFKISIVFIHSANKDDRKRVFVEHIGGISDQELLKEALHGWFTSEVKDITKWAEQYKLQSTSVPYDEMHLQQWVEIADVDATPTFFVNGYRLPKTYRVADIRYLITEVPLHYPGTNSPITLSSEGMISS